MPGLNALRVENWRCHAAVEMAPGGAPWVVVAGANGAGKTSLLEAVFTAARGRSFRTPAVTDVIREGEKVARAIVRCGGDPGHLLGLEVRRNGHELRLDGEKNVGIARVAEAVPVEYISGDAHALITGSPSARRRFLDWTLFHVEPSFVAVWRGWARAHRQRNALLRAGERGSALAPWTAAVVEYGEQLSGLRERLVGQMNAALQAVAVDGPLGVPVLGFRRGWRNGELSDALARSASREIAAGRAVVGPQLDDWVLEVGGLGTRQLSRGQAKLTSLVVYRAQSVLLEAAGRKGVLLVDDLAADLDDNALRAALGVLDGAGQQVWICMLGGEARIPLPGTASRFHVEPNRVEPL